MIQLRINELLQSKGVRFPFRWLRKLGITHSTAHTLLSGKAHRISMAHVNDICAAINCTPNDLYAYTIGKKENALPPEHQLHSIAPRVPSTILEKLKNMTEAEIAAWEARMEG